MALNNVTPPVVLNVRLEQILQLRKEVQLQTIDRRRCYDRALREFTRPPSSTRALVFYTVLLLLVANTPHTP
jgi:hypothetical protein